MANTDCRFCERHFPTRYQVYKHTMEEHVAAVVVGGASIEQTDAGFLCPICILTLENAWVFSRHVKKEHHLRYRAIRDSINIFPIDFPPPAANDRLIFRGVDISERFYHFRLAVKTRAEQNPKVLTLEGHVQHILALSSVLLLRPGRTHADLHEHIDLETCEQLLNDTLIANIVPRRHQFPNNIRDSVRQILERLIHLEPLELPNYAGPYTRVYAYQEITALIEGPTATPINKVLVAIRNLVQYLPRYVIESEGELIIRILRPIFAPLFEDLDDGFRFRWINDVNIGENTARPSASINIVHEETLGARVGCGQVRAQHQAANQALLARDLIEIGQMAKDASDGNNTRLTFAFTIVGTSGTFYILQRTQQDLYLMCEVEQVRFPSTLEEIVPFLAELNRLLAIMTSFAQAARQEHHDYDHSPHTLVYRQLRRSIDPDSWRRQ